MTMGLVSGLQACLNLVLVMVLLKDFWPGPMIYGCMSVVTSLVGLLCPCFPSLVSSYYISNAMLFGLLVDPVLSQLQACKDCTAPECSCSIWLMVSLGAGLLFQVLGIATAMSLQNRQVATEAVDQLQRGENAETSYRPNTTRSNLTERLMQRDQDESPDDVERAISGKEQSEKREQREKISEEARRMARSVFG
uniref:Uncharacterized protein n=1 Tax=Hanusia phi TaxID=3032 RepID=A0A7S0NCP0_9CRYP